MNNIIDKVLTSNNIVLLCHDNPDGDAIGSTLAMYHTLKKLGKEVDIVIYPYLLLRAKVDYRTVFRWNKCLIKYHKHPLKEKKIEFFSYTELIGTLLFLIRIHNIFPWTQ